MELPETDRSRAFPACNPYIKEHAVMCLKFLLESNPANQKLVSSLEAREVVPPPSGDDTLNRMGVDVRVGDDGKVKVTSNGTKPNRSKNGDSGPAAASSGKGQGRVLEDEARGAFQKLDLKDSAQGQVKGHGVGGDQADDNSDVDFM